MIEIISKDESEKTLQGQEDGDVILPKNIRQVGSPRGRHRIYLEDYVYTYLRGEARDHERCAAVFLGKSQVVKDIRYTFASGVIECSSAVFQWENISLDESFWDYIYKEQKQFFPEQEIVGWALGKAGQAMELNAAVEAAHRKYFAGRDKVLMLLDILEGEELFFVYDQGYLQKREGYYIYYEKNLAMQGYMIYKREEERRLAELKYSESLEEDAEEDVVDEAEGFPGDDGQAQESVIHTQEWQDARPMPKEPKTQAEEALESYRRMLLERQGRRVERRSRRFLYTASCFFLVALCVMGITTINNYRKMQEVESVLNIMRQGGGSLPSAGNADTAGGDAASGEAPLVVETVESQIEPLPDTAAADKTNVENAANDEKAEPSGNAGRMQEGKGAAGEEPKDGNAGEEPGAGNAAAGSGNENNTAGEPRNENNAAGEPGNGNDAAGEPGNGNDAAGEPGNGNDAAGGQEAQADQEASAVEQDGGKRYYTVQAGDTLNTICLNIYHTKDMVQALKEANGIEDGDKILVGQRLLLP